MVGAKARLLTHNAARIYGSNWKTKIVFGKVAASEKRIPDGTTRKATFVTAEWVICGNIVVKELNARNVEYYPDEDILPVFVEYADADDPVDATAVPVNENAAANAAASVDPPPTDDEQSEDIPPINNLPPDPTLQEETINNQNEPPAPNTTQQNDQPPAPNTTQQNPANLPSYNEGAPPPPSSVAQSTLPTSSKNNPTTATATNNNAGAAPNNGIVAQIAHERRWVLNDTVLQSDLNGPIPHRQWYVTNPVGERITQNDTNKVETMSRLDLFLMMFPPTQLQHIINLTNRNLRKEGRRETSKGEIVKFFGIIILGTKFEFASRRDLWETASKSKYIDPPRFG